MITWRDGTSIFFTAASITAYSGAVATINSVLLSLSATTWMLRTTPRPAPAAPPAAPPAVPAAPPEGVGARWSWITTCGCAIAGCAWNAGGDTIVPAGVPGATVGAAGAAACCARPENACWSSGASFSARVFCRL